MESNQSKHNLKRVCSNIKPSIQKGLYKQIHINKYVHILQIFANIDNWRNKTYLFLKIGVYSLKKPLLTD